MMSIAASRDESQWFRIACVTVVAAVCLPAIADGLMNAAPELTAESGGDPVRGGIALAVLGAIALLISSIFALACWLTLRPDEQQTGGGGGSSSLLVQLLLGLQLFGCFAITVELVYLVSAQAGATLPWKQAARWQAGVLAIIVLVAALAVSDGTFEPVSGLTHLSYSMQVAATVVNVSAWSLFAFAAGRMIVAERSRRQELAFANAELRATQDLLEQTARQGERLRIARELHDTLGHHLTGLALNLELAGQLLLQAQPAEHASAEVRGVVERSHLLAKLLLNDVRETVDSMRGSASEGVNIAQALRSMAATVPQQQVAVAVPDHCYVPDTETAHVLVRCAQEGLTNAMRHSQARHIRVAVDLTSERDYYGLIIADDGQGAAGGAAVQGNGLRGVRERVQALGGELDIRTSPRAGFELRVRLPRHQFQEAAR